MTTTSIHHHDSMHGMSLKSPWKSPRGGFAEMKQQRRREEMRKELERTPARGDDVPKLSKTLSDFSITHSDCLAWSPQPMHSPIPFSFQHPNLPQTTPPRISHSTLASPFKSGGARSHAAVERDRERSRWDIPIVSRGRWRARSGSVIANPNSEGYGVRANTSGHLRMDVSPQPTLIDSPSAESTHSDRVRKWTETTKIAESPSSEPMRIGSSILFPTSPSMSTQIVSTTSASLGHLEQYAGTPTSPTPPPHLHDGRRSVIPSTPGDAIESISSTLPRTTASLPRRSHEQTRFEGPSFTQRKSASARNEVRRLRDDGRASPLDAGVIDIFFDHGVSSSSSASSDSSPIPADRQTVIRPRLLKRRTTSGESGGWSIATKRSMSSMASSLEISLPLPSKPTLDTRPSTEKLTVTMSPLGEKFGHGAMSPKIDESPLQLTRKRLSPGAAEEGPSSRRHDPAVIAPRPAMFRHITAPAGTSLRHITRVATPDPIETDRMQTPLPAFVAERPSPFAFVSSGLMKKGTPSSMSNRSTAGSSGMSSNASKHTIDNPFLNGLHRFPSSALASVIMANDMPDTPIKAGPVVEGLPRIVTRPPPVDIAAATTGSHLASRGLRRKRSAMWNRAHSGSVSSLGGSDGFEPEPTTPTREEDLAAIQQLCTITPEPPTAVQSYPFASNCMLEKGKPIDSPSPPHKRFSILSRLKSTKQQRPLARTSNPLLSLAYKLGADQVKSTTRSPVASQSTEEKTTGGRFEQDFVVLEPVGQGEFSMVWKVREKRSGEIFAVKRGKAYSGAKDRQRQLQEVDILQTLSSHPHPHVVEFHGAWEQSQQLHLRTAFAECGDLATYLLSIADAGGLDEIRCWKVLTEMTCGLRHIHNLGILHLDLKPSNILINKTGSLRISDFGLSTRQGDTTSERACSRQLGPSSSDASLREGDREYLSPEILRGEFGRAADAFSLGITMLEVFMNVILPSNGDAWQKLRSDDFSDLIEHFAITKSPIATSFGSMSTSLQSMTSLGSCTTYAEDSTSPSSNSPLLPLIKALMLSDPTSRMTVDGIWSHPIIYRIAGMLSTCMDSRMSGEAHSTHSSEEWSAWEKRQLMATSPDATKVEFAGRAMSMVQPALVVEVDSLLWDEVLID